MTRPGRKKLAILLSAAFLVVTAVLVIVYIELADLGAHKTDIVSTIKKALNRDVSYENAEISFAFGPILTVRQIEIREKDRSSIFATADGLSLKVALLPLLWKKVVIREIVLENPRMTLIRYPSGLFNISDLLEERKTPWSIEVKGLAITNGHVEFDDQQVSTTSVKTVLDGLRFRIGDLRRGKMSQLEIETAITCDGVKGSLSLLGKIGLTGEDTPIYRSSLEGRLRLQGLSLEKLWPYYRRYVPFEKMAGILDADTHLKGNIDDFSISGAVSAEKTVLDYPQVFHATLKPQKITVECQLKRSLSEIAIENIRAAVDGVKVSGRFSIRDIDKKDPYIDASAVTNPMPLETYGMYIPYGIIPKGVSSFIEDHIKGGIYQLQEGTLRGRVSEIAHMEKGQNYKVLHIKGTVKEGRLSFGDRVPAFSKISGILELKDKDFHLRQMTGVFGESPLSLEGRIADYPLSTPATYPFEMTMTPGPREVAWLTVNAGIEQAAYSGRSTLKLSGKGPTDQYELEGDWDLAGAAYRFKDIFVKRQGRSNRLTFRLVLSDNEVRLINSSFDLAPLSLKVSGIYPFQEKRRASFVFDSNAFPVEKIAEAFPVMGKWHPRGVVRISAQAEGLTQTEEAIRWRGSVTLSDCSFQPGESLGTVTGLKGTVKLQNDLAETPLLSGQIGSTPFRARVVLSGFSDPTLYLRLSAKVLDLKDVGLTTPGRQVLVRDVEGDVVWNEREIRINSLTGFVNRSNLTIRGHIPDLKKPYYDIRVTSSHLDTDDLKFIQDVAEIKKSKTSPELTVKAVIQSAEGRLQGLPYTKLAIDCTYRNETAQVTSFHFNTLEGSISGHGFLMLASGMKPRYQAHFDIDRISAGKAVGMTDLDPDLITGSLSVKGDLVGSGLEPAEVMRSAAGSMNLQMEKGTLRKFRVLSKVFSILNVSQLLKFQLPDMVSGGMPYTLVTGNFSLKDGILASEDLYVKSEAMNISVVGSVDFINKELNETIGVQPLQTVDKVVSRIPVVGWILTNETNSIISMYFTAKGKWDDPTVQAIPVKDMAEGVFNIFRRLFQLPVKLITDTGDVILGR
jgi:uncharacterized protein YhdP